jgi:hypothetical protein
MCHTYATMRTVLLTLIISLFSLAVAQEGQLKLEPSSLLAGQSQLTQLVQEAVRQGTGNPDSQSIHFVIGIKTGFFADDPVKSEAARAVASQLISDLAVVGDQVTVKAFEFGVWEHRSADNTFTMTSSAKDDLTKIQAIADALPKAPKAGSLGGHDLERSVVEIESSLNGSSDAVIILLLNSAPSQSAAGEKLIGGNAPEYQALLERWTRVPGTKEGASLELPYKVLLPSGGSTEAKLVAVIFAPKTFSSVALSGGSRSELLAGTANTTPVSTPVSTPTPQADTGFPLWLIGIPLLAILGFLAFRAFAGGNSGAGWNLSIDGGNPERFALSSVTTNRTLVELVGANYQNSNGDSSSQIRKAPDGLAVARFIRVANGLRLEGMNGFDLKELNSDTHSGSALLKFGGIESHDAVLGGNVQSSTGVNREVNINVSFRISKDGG